MRHVDRGVAGHLRMTPRQFVESLRRPIRFDGIGLKDTRLQEIEGWFWAESKWPTWGAGGRAFINRAKIAVLKGDFEAWLDSLPPVKVPPARKAP